MLVSVQEMLNAFEENKIIYCHWKSNEHLGPALQGDTDLDILVNPKQRSLIESILNQLKLKKFSSIPSMRYNAIEDYIGYDSKVGKIWHLHLHFGMTIGEYHLKNYTVNPWRTYLLQNRIWNNLGIYTSTPETELTLLIVRVLLKMRWRDLGSRFNKDIVKEYKWLIKRIDKCKFEETVRNMVGETSASQILKLLVTDFVYRIELITAQRIVRKDLKPFRSFNRVLSLMLRAYREISWILGGIERKLLLNRSKPTRRFSPSGGFVIAFLGCDGSGKSTTIANISREFRKKIDIKTIYLGSGSSSASLIRKPMIIVAQRIGGKGINKSIQKIKSGKKRKGIHVRLYEVSKIIWAITLAKEKKSKLIQITKARNNGMLVLVDRYPQINVPGLGDGPLLHEYQNYGGVMEKISRWEHDIYCLAHKNPPDLAVKLTVPTNIAIHRKPKMTYEDIEKKKDVVNGIWFEDEIIVDTSKNQSITTNFIIDEIWKRL